MLRIAKGFAAGGVKKPIVRPGTAASSRSVAARSRLPSEAPSDASSAKCSRLQECFIVCRLGVSGGQRGVLTPYIFAVCRYTWSPLRHLLLSLRVIWCARLHCPLISKHYLLIIYSIHLYHKSLAGRAFLWNDIVAISIGNSFFIFSIIIWRGLKLSIAWSCCSLFKMHLSQQSVLFAMRYWSAVLDGIWQDIDCTWWNSKIDNYVRARSNAGVIQIEYRVAICSIICFNVCYCKP